MKRSVVVFVVGLMLMAVVLVGVENRTGAAQEDQNKKALFEHVVPFTTTGGFFGFFDQADGKVYLYDSQFERLVLEAQLTALGQPPKVLRSQFSDDSQEKLEYKR